ncbi:alpha/beta hydrolase [Ginsengibacter hankyongi]|uniref:Alpha/beta hydrolase n=1 Tax=Ginsengibacter hankyongi TaxID=2607284 RepID=A0A5J5IHE0_9BACT|nr:alpha/beta hydrolase [Ginsengibacter hankyongi]KAA9040475.1 alpha/beta hydrolase [Ginsengibacter hankyongi]
MKKTTITSLFLICFMQYVNAQQTIPLYEGKIPNSKPYAIKEWWQPQSNGDTIVHYISQPTLTIFLPEKSKANGTAVVICPGGGYWITSIVKEGFAVARKFNEWGIAAFVLNYRIPNDSSMVDKKIGPLQDAQRAIQLVRLHANEWNIDVNKVGIMGFSAGGHLASTAATHFQHSYINNTNNINLRPDFAMLIYPVISFQDNIGHIGSRDQLIGKNPSKELIDSFSNELQVTAETPTTFLVQATDDNVVPVMNSISFYEALLKYKIPAEMHIYNGGGHGFGMHNRTTKDEWMERCKNWMQSMNLIGK